MSDADLPSRKHPAHGVLHLPHQPTIIFDTVCTKGRRPWLACKDVHELLREMWTGATAWLLGRYVIMPDHIHFFAAATESPIAYENWVKYWKSQFTRRHGDPSHRWLTDHWTRGCGLTSSMRRNGITSATIPCGTGWSRIPMSGHTRVRSTGLIGRETQQRRSRAGEAPVEPERELRRPIRWGSTEFRIRRQTSTSASGI